MPTERQVQETIDRSVFVMARYHNAKSTQAVKDGMIAEIETLAAWAVGELLIPPCESDAIVDGVGRGLIDLYGVEVGSRLVGEFDTVIRGAAGRYVQVVGAPVYNVAHWPR